MNNLSIEKRIGRNRTIQLVFISFSSSGYYLSPRVFIAITLLLLNSISFEFCTLNRSFCDVNPSLSRSRVLFVCFTPSPVELLHPHYGALHAPAHCILWLFMILSTDAYSHFLCNSLLNFFRNWAPNLSSSIIVLPYFIFKCL